MRRGFQVPPTQTGLRFVAGDLVLDNLNHGLGHASGGGRIPLRKAVMCRVGVGRAWVVGEEGVEGDVPGGGYCLCWGGCLWFLFHITWRKVRKTGRMSLRMWRAGVLAASSGPQTGTRQYLP